MAFLAIGREHALWEMQYASHWPAVSAAEYPNPQIEQ
jgi:hypothetical protein